MPKKIKRKPDLLDAWLQKIFHSIDVYQVFLQSVAAMIVCWTQLLQLIHYNYL
jgi:hypothetical protein